MVPAIAMTDDIDTVERLASISCEARELLRPLAEIEPDDVRIMSGPHAKLGSHESIGLLLMLAKLPEQPSDEEVNKYLQAGEDGISKVLDFISTMLVILTLCMSIQAPLMVYTLVAYDPTDASLGGEPVYLGWSQPDVAHALHWSECVFMAFSLTFAMRGITLGCMLYSGFALYLPDMEDKLSFALQSYKSLANVWTSAAGTMFWFALALPFLAARVSPVASVCAALPLVGFCLYCTVALQNFARALAKLQVNRAKRLCATKRSALPMRTMGIADQREAAELPAPALSGSGGDSGGCPGPCD